MRITVAICTWNRCSLLEQTLQRLTEVAVPPHVTREVVVVNNNCTDATNEVAAAFEKSLSLRVLQEPVPGLSNARNRALLETDGDYIAWVDDDVLVDRDWLSALADAAARRPDAGSFGGPIEPWFPVTPDPTLMAVFPALKKGFCGLDHGADELDLRADQSIFGANMVYSRKASEGLQFDPNLGRTATNEFGLEDTDFMARVRARGSAVVWVPRMRVKHYVDPKRMTLEYLTRFSFDRGRSLMRHSPPYDGPHLMGAPRWMWRAVAQHFASYAALRLTPFRRQALERLRDYQCTRGMLVESLAQRGARQ